MTMMNDPIEVAFRAASVSEIRAKAAAYEVLFGVTPELLVGGTVDTYQDSTAYLGSPRHKVIEIGHKFITVDIGDEGTFKMDVAANAESARYVLRDQGR